MTDAAAIREHWNQRAALGETAGTQDLILKELEQRAILGEIDPRRFEPRADATRWQPRNILEIGCGLGQLAGMVASKAPSAQVWAIDTAESMIEGALRIGVQNVTFRPGDVFSLPDHVTFDLIYTERCLINLGTWAAQKATIDAISAKLVDGGSFIMCEHSQDGLDAINEARAAWNRPAIEPPWHNRYFRQVELNTITSLTFVKMVPFSATYYFLSRVLNDKLAEEQGLVPSYDARINKLALRLPHTCVDSRFAQGRLWCWEKR